MNDYLKFRGKCKELSEEACAKDPSLTMVRGHYYCPIWDSNEPHWWTVRQDGSVFDPSEAQFPSMGMGEYTPFDGNVTCEECAGLGSNIAKLSYDLADDMLRERGRS